VTWPQWVAVAETLSGSGSRRCSPRTTTSPSRTPPVGVRTTRGRSSRRSRRAPSGSGWASWSPPPRSAIRPCSRNSPRPSTTSPAAGWRSGWAQVGGRGASLPRVPVPPTGERFEISRSRSRSSRPAHAGSLLVREPALRDRGLPIPAEATPAPASPDRARRPQAGIRMQRLVARFADEFNTVGGHRRR